MTYEDQICSLIEYFKSGEKSPQNFKIGMEFEHFILHSDSLETVSYSKLNGIEDIMLELIPLGWKPTFESDHLIALDKSGSTITLEPGGQFELSTPPFHFLKNTEECYLDFLSDILPIIKQYGYSIASLGYQPKSLIANLPFLPKKRYEYMQKYLQTKGSLAHNMMKGTASTQVTLDYKDEQDYIRKNRIIYYLSPLIYAIFDNAPIFEGEVYTNRSARSLIWSNCDPDRCGYPKGVLGNKFGYAAYAEFILSTPAIVYNWQNKLFPVDDKLIKDIYNPSTFSKEELEYLLTMVFPDARTKTFIEIRMGDALPYPLNIAYGAFWKGLLYNEKNLDTLYADSLEISIDELKLISKNIHTYGLSTLYTNKNVFDTFKYLLNLASEGLDDSEKNYLIPLISLTESGLTVKDITLNNIELGIKDAANWCLINKMPQKGGFFSFASK